MFRTLDSTRAYQGFSCVRVDRLAGPTGTFTREVVEHPDAVAIVALDDRERVALVRQYRHPLGMELLEIPAGTLDVAGEDADAAARRELAEEVGLAATRLTTLGTIWNSAGWSDERTTLYLATGLRDVERPAGFVAQDEEAAMALEWRALDEVVDDALAGRITDAKTVVGVLRARSVLDGGPGAAHG